MTALLRGSVGCSEAKLVHLSQAELDRCAKWRQAQVDPDLAIPAPIAPEKRAWFDAALAAYKSNGHPPGFVCGMLIDGAKLVKPKTPPHSLKLGPLPCFVVPPKLKGVSDEADVETPSRQAANGAALRFTPHISLSNDNRLAP